MEVPRPKDLVKEVDDMYLTELGRVLMRRGVIRSQDMKGKLVVRSVSGAVYVAEDCVLSLSKYIDTNGLTLRGPHIADLILNFGGHKYELMTKQKPEVVQKALDYIFECWGNQKVDLEEWLRNNLMEDAASIMRMSL